MDVNRKSVALGEIIKEFDLEILNQGPDYEKTPLRTEIGRASCRERV